MDNAHTSEKENEKTLATEDTEFTEIEPETIYCLCSVSSVTSVAAI